MGVLPTFLKKQLGRAFESAFQGLQQAAIREIVANIEALKAGQDLDAVSAANGGSFAAAVSFLDVVTIAKLLTASSGASFGADVTLAAGSKIHDDGNIALQATVGHSTYSTDTSGSPVQHYAASGTSGNQVVNASQFALTTSASGFSLTMPGGLIIKSWTGSVVFTGSTGSFNWPTSFPTAMMGAVANNSNYNSGGQYVIGTTAVSPGTVALAAWGLGSATLASITVIGFGH